MTIVHSTSQNTVNFAHQKNFKKLINK